MYRIFLAFFLITAVPAQAAQRDKAIELVNKLSGGKAQVVSTFDATTIGMTGLVMKRGGSYVIVYVNPEGKYMISGVVIDADGKNLSQQYSDKFIPKPDYSGMWKAAEKTAYVEYGSPSAAAVIYVVGETNCGYCKRFHKDIKPYVSRGDVSVRWILMGFDDAADAKAAAVLSSANQKEALELLYEKGQAGKGSAAALQRIKINHEFAETYGVTGTPFILARGVDGIVMTTPGAVQGKDLEKLVASASR